MKLTKVKSFDEALALAHETRTQFEAYASYVLTRKRKVIEEHENQFYVSEKGKLYYSFIHEGVRLFNDFSNSSLTSGFPSIGIINGAGEFTQTGLTDGSNNRFGWLKFARGFMKKAEIKDFTLAYELEGAGHKFNLETDTLVFSKTSDFEQIYFTKSE